ncbi:hypothetical protein A0J57_06915 [Sphingobium sp. 22B]|uniref:DUF883 family protein n=1 Tax=unclassified Sphingobium TaxID=2611147 RepID=UPI000782320F|nr:MULTISPECIES: DUF883 family protein [unclassified Sphingobium]KXU32933.1 hypothetical protein AXW74_04945 [Sphingobium sp. AM]KYC33113.1 hypothetical protein A0J57_06915 [Sphingobium sp. 22B]OAP33230.1 hypothetical protein A8O16_05025 [Sphingobium sp. 20006FA]
MADIRTQLTRAREAANDIAGTASGKFRDTADRARESAGDLIQTSREKAGDAYADARDRSQRIAARANEIVQEHPIAAVAGAVAAGAVIAWMFPRSRAAMKALPGLASSAGAKVLEAALAARAVAAENAESLRSNAGEALHNAAEGTREAAASARDSVASADLGAKASRLADDVAALVAAKVDALSEAVKARLPKT